MTMFLLKNALCTVQKAVDSCLPRREVLSYQPQGRDRHLINDSSFSFTHCSALSAVIVKAAGLQAISAVAR